VSSIDNYECGCVPMNDLRAIAAETPGVLGVRFSGAGFRGCCVALVLPEQAEAAAEAIRSKYAAAHPDLAQRAHIVITRPGDGARSE
jgi:galacturonokinase